MSISDVWQAAKRNEAEKHELNRKLQRVPGILGCWQPHNTSTTFTLWGDWEGEYYDETFKLSDHDGFEAWYKVDQSGKIDQLVPPSNKDARLLMKIWENFVENWRNL